VQPERGRSGLRRDDLGELLEVLGVQVADLEQHFGTVCAARVMVGETHL
jgi:hypothetical protein